MIAAEDFLAPARARGLDFVTGVPCSLLTPLINRASGLAGYVGAASEGEAVAVAAGAWLAGRGAMVICQNSGLGNAVNPLTSLNAPFRIPVLMVVTWRGEPGHPDEPQHEVMGRITHDLLSLLSVEHAPFPDAPDAVAPALERAGTALADGRPYAFVMSHGAVRDEPLAEPARTPHPPGPHEFLDEGGDRPARAALLERLLSLLPESAAVVATTGKCGRELFTLSDREQHLYQVGSMGGAAGMGLGVALARAARGDRRRVVVLDGDGAALMKLGTLATIGACRPEGLVHVILDNGVHDSTGGQSTASPFVRFAEVALGCGYAHALSCDSEAGFARAMERALSLPGPVLVHARIRPGSMKVLGRPTVPPHEVARRFRAFLTRGD